jgi:L-phenylalanine/L-methionine N-acetyltransferase
MIRKATAQDFDFIYGLHIHPQINRFLFYEIMSEDDFKIIFNDLLAQGALYVYEEGSKLIGMFKLVPGSHRASHVVNLGGVAIHPSWSGKGYGQKMLEQVIVLGKERGFVRMELGVSTINSKAIHLYEKAGFKKEGIREKFIYLKSENRLLDDTAMAYLYE